MVKRMEADGVYGFLTASALCTPEGFYAAAHTVQQPNVPGAQGPGERGIMSRRPLVAQERMMISCNEREGK